MIQFYKPNKKVTGTACSFWMNDDGSVMCSMIKQDGWNDQKHTGSFAKNKDNPNGRVIVKLGNAEVGGVIDCLESNREWSTYHRSSKQSLQIKFGPYNRSGEQIGFSFAVNKQDAEDSTNKVGFIIGFSYPEARYLKEFLISLLRRLFEMENAKRSAYSSKSKSSKLKVSEPIKNVEDVNLVDDDDDDLAW